MTGKSCKFSGYGFSLRGEKNRFVLPPSFRNKIHDASGERVLCLVKHEAYRCLVGFGTNYTEELEERFEREEANAFDKGIEFDSIARRMELFAFEEMPFDNSGRFILPEHLVKVAGLSDSFCVVGAGKIFTLWAPEELYKMGDRLAAMQEACRSLEAEARAKGKK